MRAALAELSPAERTAIVNAALGWCGIEEIAAVLKSNSCNEKYGFFGSAENCGGH